AEPGPRWDRRAGGAEWRGEDHAAASARGNAAPGRRHDHRRRARRRESPSKAGAGVRARWRGVPADPHRSRGPRLLRSPPRRRGGAPRPRGGGARSRRAAARAAPRLPGNRLRARNRAGRRHGGSGVGAVPGAPARGACVAGTAQVPGGRGARRAGRRHGALTTFPPPMSLHLFNTLTRQVEPFAPLEPPRVTMYTCGPTVWNFAHIGNFRTFLFEDLLRRHLEWSGYDVF